MIGGQFYFFSIYFNHHLNKAIKSCFHIYSKQMKFWRPKLEQTDICRQFSSFLYIFDNYKYAMHYKDRSQDSQAQILSRCIQEKSNKKAQKRNNNNRLQQQDSESKQLHQFDRLYQSVGMLRALWMNKETKITEYIHDGTAFVVAPQIILTCTHNIYHEETGTVADQIIFVPSHQGYITSSTPTFHSFKGEYYQFTSLDQGQTMKKVPTTNELCLIALSQSIKCQNYVTIGICTIRAEEYVEIIGFPSDNYIQISNLIQVCLERMHLRGKTTSIKENIINHSLSTKTGHSGSAILYQTATKQIVATGIHTHSGQASNNMIVNKIKEFQGRLARNFQLSHQIGVFDQFRQVQVFYQDQHKEQVKLIEGSNYASLNSPKLRSLRKDFENIFSLGQFKIYTGN